MGSFRASMEAFGETVDVLYSEFTFHRDTDIQGRPSSNVYGGKVTVRVAATESTAALETMLQEFKVFDAKITWKKIDEDAKMKELEIKNAYVTKYKEQLDVNGESPLNILMTFSAEELLLGNASINNRWPGRNS